jgi:hypothetical protein
MPLTSDRQQFIQALVGGGLVLLLKYSVCQRGGCQLEQVTGKTPVSIDYKLFDPATAFGLSIFLNGRGVRLSR